MKFGFVACNIVLHEAFLWKNKLNEFLFIITKKYVQANENCIRNIFYFLLPISRESIVFGTNFRNGDFDGFTRFEVP